MTTLKLKLNIWRQTSEKAKGAFESHDVEANEHMSFLEMLDVLNEKLIEEGKEPVSFEHDCREGICGSCGMVINGVPHGPQRRTTACQLHMRQFKSGEELWIEPWRATAFPIIKDLVVDRSSFDRIIQAGGYISIRTGSARDANEIAIRKEDSDAAFDAAACIGCGACAAACPNASGNLFLSAKVGHLGMLPQGQAERSDRVRKMVAQHDAENFGSCTNHGECESACPKGISVDWIAKMNRDFLKSMVTSRSEVKQRESGSTKSK